MQWRKWRSSKRQLETKRFGLSKLRNKDLRHTPLNEWPYDLQVWWNVVSAKDQEPRTCTKTKLTYQFRHSKYNVSE